MLLTCFAWMNQIVLVYLVSQIGLIRLASHIAERSEKNGCGRQSLLTVDDVKGRVLTGLRKARHKNEKAHEVIPGLGGFLGLYKALPKFGPLRPLPAIVPLENGYHVLT